MDQVPWECGINAGSNKPKAGQNPGILLGGGWEFDTSD